MTKMNIGCIYYKLKIHIKITGFGKLIASKIVNYGLIKFSLTSSSIDSDCILVSWCIFHSAFHMEPMKASLNFS